MRKQFKMLLSMGIVFCLALSGCGSSSEPSSSYENNSTALKTDTGNNSVSNNEISELTVRFGDGGQPFVMRLEDNSTADAIAGYVGTSDWRLPIYSYDESDVMQYYDVPSRYEIPSDPETVTQANAGDVFYSEPNRIVLYYHDAEISEEYTKIGTFDATQEFISAVEDNPVLGGWGNKLVLISADE